MAFKREFPNTYVIISMILLLCAVCTWVVPGGVPQTWQVFSALFEGFIKHSDIIAFILIIGGTFWLISKSKAIDAGIFAFMKLMLRLEKKNLDTQIRHWKHCDSVHLPTFFHLWCCIRHE